MYIYTHIRTGPREFRRPSSKPRCSRRPQPAGQTTRPQTTPSQSAAENPHAAYRSRAALGRTYTQRLCVNINK